MEPVHYREIAPGPELAGAVECLWTIRSDAPVALPRLNRVLPDGCMDLVFDLAHPRCYAVGTMRRPLELWVEGRVEMLGVRFLPGAATPFLALPAAELTDGTAELDAVWGPAARELEARLHDAPAAGRPGVVREELIRRLRAGEGAHRVVRSASLLIERSGGSVPVAEIERALGVGRRRLERLFAEHVGVSPKTAARIARFRRALALMRRRPAPAWSRLALEAGYYDQAHLIREFRSLSGLTPAALRAEREGVASVQYGGADPA